MNDGGSRFRRWFCQVVASHVKAQTNDVVEKHRAERLLREEDAAHRLRRCGWTCVGAFCRGMGCASFSLGVLFAIWGCTAILAVVVGTTAFLSCGLPLPQDQCVALEVQNSAGHVLIPADKAWIALRTISLYCESVQLSLGVLLGVDRVDQMTRTVCERVKMSDVAGWQQWAGVYKLP